MHLHDLYPQFSEPSASLLLREAMHSEYMTLFPSVSLSDAPRGAGEAFFAFLARLDTPEAAATRARLEAWFSEYPADFRDILRGQMSVKDAKAFWAGALELFAFLLLHRLGLAPDVIPRRDDQGEMTADFRAHLPEGGEALVECTSTSDAPDVPEWKYDGELRRGLQDAVSAHDVPAVLLHVVRYGRFKSTVGSGSVRKQVHKFLTSPEVAAYVTARLDGREAESPRHRLAAGGAEVILEAHVLAAGAAATIGWRLDKPDDHAPTNPDGTLRTDLLPWAPAAERTTQAIWKALRRKTSHYGAISTPFVVVLNVFGQYGPALNEEIVPALYGRLPNDPLQNDFSTVGGRRDGLWTPGSNTRLSGVLVVSGLFPAPVGEPVIRLYLNPWASDAVPAPFLLLPHVRAEGDMLVQQHGRTWDDLFGP